MKSHRKSHKNFPEISNFLSIILLMFLSLVALGAKAAPSEPASQPEVSSLHFETDKVTLTWDPLADPVGYHVYRGLLSDLPSGNYGECLKGSIQGTSTEVPDEPLPGSCFVYLVSGFDEDGEGSLGTSPSGPRTVSIPCSPARRFFDLTINGDPGDGVEDGLDPRRNPSAKVWSSSREVTGVFLHTGEFFLSATDLAIPGRGLGNLEGDERIEDRLGDPGDSNISLLECDERIEDRLGDASCRERIEDRLGMMRDERIEDRLGDVSCRERIEDRLGMMRDERIEDRLGDCNGDGSVIDEGIDWLFTRTYRSQILYDGPLGHGWDFKFNARLAPLGADALFFDGTGKKEVFYREDATHFTSPPGLYAVLIENPDGSFTLRYPDGSLINFHAFDGSNVTGCEERIEDRLGDAMVLDYDDEGLLRTIIDAMGRTVTLDYDSEGRIISLTDFSGRSLIYSYDGHGNLSSMRSPTVTGTPNGIDFPDGKTTTYTYSTDSDNERLKHNLISIIPPVEEGSELPELQNIYETDPLNFKFDRVISQTVGGTNDSGIPAGGTLSYSYSYSNGGADPYDPTIPRRIATVIDRDGNEKEYTHNYSGNLLELIEYTNRNLRPGEPDYTSEYSYNLDGEVLEISLPEGNQILYTYDSPGDDRFREGNILEKRMAADTIASGGRGDGHGSEISDSIWTFTYEHVNNRLATIIEPRGNDTGYIPQNGGTQSPERYTTKWTYDYQEGDPASNGINDLASRFGIALGSTSFNLGDINGDGITSQAFGNAVMREDPTVHLDPDSNQAAIQGDTTQERVTLYQCNDLGQLCAVIDAEENKHEFIYYPETDPDGDGTDTPAPPDGRTLDPVTGGYLKTSTLDTTSSPGRNNKTNPTPASIQIDYEYDPVGNLVSRINGRGVRTKWIYNELNQVVEIRRAASTADASGPDGSPATGRGETGLTAFGHRTRIEYDANDNTVKYQREDKDQSRGLGNYIDATITYDLLDHPVEVQQEISPIKNLPTQYRYDANENLIQITQPEGNAHDMAYDERDLILSVTRGASGPRGGTASTTSYDYDGNYNLVEITDGRGNPIEYLYDGFDRLARGIDQLGNTVDLYYDPSSNMTLQLWRGPVGAVPPTNTDLGESYSFYDEGNRRFRYDQVLFVPEGVSPARTPILNEGSLIPGDGRINRIYEYDRLSRFTFDIKDSESTIRLDYDGLGNSGGISNTDVGESFNHHDGGGNLVELIYNEHSSSSGPPSEMSFTTFFYDSLNRMTMAVDNVGQTWRYLYDSLDAVVIETDPNGPSGGTINRRSPGYEGETVNINSHGNVTHYTYDGLDRRITTSRTLTSSGLGDGTASPDPDTSNPYNSDGKVTLIAVWDDNSLIQELTDDRSNIISYSYDNLNRLTTITADDSTQTTYAYDANDNPITITDANGSVISSSYDAANRKTATNVTRADGLAGTTQQTFAYDGLHRLRTCIDNNEPLNLGDNVMMTFIYDSLGRVIEKSQLISDGSGALYTDYGWLAQDLQTDLIYPTGRRIQYSYDARERLISIADALGPESVSFEYFGLFREHTRYYPSGERSTRLDINGVSDIGYDGIGRTVLFRHMDVADSLLAGFEYTYDRASNRKSVRRTHHGGGGNYRGELYEFDSSNRLISFQEGVLNPDLEFVIYPLADEQSWTLDGAGNWPLKARNAETYQATPNNLNEYDEMSSGTKSCDGISDDFLDPVSSPIQDGMSLCHDKNGNQYNCDYFIINYDAFNRAVKAWRISGGQNIANYIYNALGQRVRREVLNSGDLNETKRYLYANSMASAGVIEERDETSSVERQVIYKYNQPIWQLQPGVPESFNAHYFLEDAQGSICALMHGTEQRVVERVTYDAYGKPIFEDADNQPILDLDSHFIARSQYGNSNLFLTQLYDPELGARTGDINTDLGGLYLFGSRPYNPNQGRFITRDNSSYGNGLSSAGNPYAFAGNAPVNISGPYEPPPPSLHFMMGPHVPPGPNICMVSGQTPPPPHLMMGPINPPPRCPPFMMGPHVPPGRSIWIVSDEKPEPQPHLMMGPHNPPPQPPGLLGPHEPPPRPPLWFCNPAAPPPPIFIEGPHAPPPRIPLFNMSINHYPLIPMLMGGERPNPRPTQWIW